MPAALPKSRAPGGLDYRDFTERWLAHKRVARVGAFAEVVEGADRYPLLSAVVPGRKTLLITAGFHGDEVAGPLTLVKHLPAIAAYARSKDVGLRVYPCLNPSGFADGTRYNRSREAPNNDFLRYEVSPGVWCGELKAGQSFLRWDLQREGPKETRALRAELEGLPTPDAALDIHQDPWLGGEVAYAYTFDQRAAYQRLVAATAGKMPLGRNIEVDENVRTDADGLIELHDGSVTDYMSRRGVGYTAALETTTTAAAAACDQVNLVWIYGFVDLAAA